jgi:hypothetical protein
MSPRHENKPQPRAAQPHAGSLPSHDRERHIEDSDHHPSAHPLPHPPHHPQAKPELPARHNSHSHPHGDELPAHTNPPGPIKPSKKLTKTGKI